jgi:hypothetical protein
MPALCELEVVYEIIDDTRIVSTTMNPSATTSAMPSS